MKKPLKPFFLIVPLLALWSAATAAQASLEDQLAAAEAKWQMKKPKTYEFSVKFCVSCPPSGWYLRLEGPIRFRVEDGQASRLTKPLYSDVLEGPPTIPNQRYPALIERRYSKNALLPRTARTTEQITVPASVFFSQLTADFGSLKPSREMLTSIRMS